MGGKPVGSALVGGGDEMEIPLSQMVNQQNFFLGTTSLPCEVKNGWKLVISNHFLVVKMWEPSSN